MTTTPLPPPPYPADTRAKGWRFEVDYEQLDQSDTWDLAAAEARPWLLMMWLAAWKQTPCGSLPADDEVLPAKFGMPADLWARFKSVMLRGWWQANDGRLYHPTLTARVREMLYARAAAAHRRFWPKVIAVHGTACFYCGRPDAETLDHVIPRSKGGANDPSNLVPACRPCNSAKGARTPDEWRANQ